MDARPTLRLEGNIVGEWAWLLERECTALLKVYDGVCLDLANVGFVDREGVAVLERLCRAGVDIWCRWDPVAGVLEGEGVRVRTKKNGTNGVPSRGNGADDEWP